MILDERQPPDDMSPALGGSRAIADEPPPPPAADPAPSGSAEPSLPDALAEIFGAEGREVMQALGAIGALAGLGSLFGQAVSTLEEELPQAIAAFGELFEELGQVVDQALSPRDDEA
jgi:hypothetical protein